MDNPFNFSQQEPFVVSSANGENNPADSLNLQVRESLRKDFRGSSSDRNNDFSEEENDEQEVVQTHSSRTSLYYYQPVPSHGGLLGRRPDFQEGKQSNESLLVGRDGDRHDSLSLYKREERKVDIHKPTWEEFNNSERSMGLDERSCEDDLESDVIDDEDSFSFEEAEDPPQKRKNKKRIVLGETGEIDETLPSSRFKKRMIMRQPPPHKQGRLFWAPDIDPKGMKSLEQQNPKTRAQSLFYLLKYGPIMAAGVFKTDRTLSIASSKSFPDEVFQKTPPEELLLGVLTLTLRKIHPKFSVTALSEMTVFTCPPIWEWDNTKMWIKFCYLRLLFIFKDIPIAELLPEDTILSQALALLKSEGLISVVARTVANSPTTEPLKVELRISLTPKAMLTNPSQLEITADLIFLQGACTCAWSHVFTALRIHKDGPVIPKIWTLPIQNLIATGHKRVKNFRKLARPELCTPAWMARCEQTCIEEFFTQRIVTAKGSPLLFHCFKQGFSLDNGPLHQNHSCTNHGGILLGDMSTNLKNVIRFLTLEKSTKESSLLGKRHLREFNSPEYDQDTEFQTLKKMTTEKSILSKEPLLSQVERNERPRSDQDTELHASTLVVCSNKQSFNELAMGLNTFNIAYSCLANLIIEDEAEAFTAEVVLCSSHWLHDHVRREREPQKDLLKRNWKRLILVNHYSEPSNLYRLCGEIRAKYKWCILSKLGEQGTSSRLAGEYHLSQFMEPFSFLKCSILSSQEFWNLTWRRFRTDLCGLQDWLFCNMIAQSFSHKVDEGQSMVWGFVPPERSRARIHHHIITLEMGDAQKKAYNDLLAQFHHSQKEGHKLNAKKLINQFSAICNSEDFKKWKVLSSQRNSPPAGVLAEHYIRTALVTFLNENPKLQCIREEIEKVINSGQKIIICSHQDEMVKLIDFYLKSEGIPYVSRKQRVLKTTPEAQAREFSLDREKNVFVTHISRMTGLDLSCANHVLIVDPDYISMDFSTIITSVTSLSKFQDVYFTFLLTADTIEIPMHKRWIWLSYIRNPTRLQKGYVEQFVKEHGHQLKIRENQ